MAKIRVKPIPGPGRLDLLFSVDNLLFAALMWSMVAFGIVLLLKDSRDQIVFIGISLAVLGWLVGSVVAIKNRIKQHTFQLILETRFNPIYREKIAVVREYFRDKKNITDEEAGKIYRGDTDELKKLEEGMGTLANFFEVLAIAVKYEDADEKILREYFGDIIIKFYERVELLLPYWRGEKTNPDDPDGSGLIGSKKAYIFMEEMAQNWRYMRLED